MGSTSKAVIVMAAGFVCLGLAVLILAIVPASGAYPGTDCYNWLSSMFGGTIAVEGDGLIALSLLLLYQGFRLFDPSRRTLRGILCTCWLFVPFFLLLSFLASDGQGRLVSALSGMAGGGRRLLAPALFSIALTVALPVFNRQRKAPEEEPESLPEAEVVPLLESVAVDDKLIAGRKAEVSSIMARILRSGKGPVSYASLQRKRKELLKLTREERAEWGMRFSQYTISDGREGDLEEVLKVLKPFTFRVSFDTANSKSLVKAVKLDSFVVPAFTEAEARALALSEIKAYSKGGYAFVRIKGRLTAIPGKESLDYDDFLLPWVSSTLRYNNDRTLFLWDFFMKYSKDRNIETAEGQGASGTYDQRF